MRLWTLQAPEVVAELRATGRYRGDWAVVQGNFRPAYRDVVAEMGRRGIDCAAAAPIWCWTSGSPVRRTAGLLLGDHEWAHGRWLLALTVPDELTMATSYAVWNDYLGYTMGFLDGPERMDWAGTPVSAWDELQVTIPELRREWVRRARALPPDAETAARIAADPVLRDQLPGSGR